MLRAASQTAVAYRRYRVADNIRCCSSSSSSDLHKKRPLSSSASAGNCSAVTDEDDYTSLTCASPLTPITTTTARREPHDRVGSLLSDQRLRRNGLLLGQQDFNVRRLSSTTVSLPSHHPTNNNNNNNAIIRVSNGNVDNVDLRYLYDSLRTFSTFMPQQLLAAVSDDNNEEGARSTSHGWRRSNVLEAYRTTVKVERTKAPASSQSQYLENDDDSFASTTTTTTTEMEWHGSKNSDQNSQHDTPSVRSQQSMDQLDTSSTSSEEAFAQEPVKDLESNNSSSSTQASFQEASAISPETEVSSGTSPETEVSSEASQEIKTAEDFDDIIQDLQTQLVAAIRGYRTNLSIQLFETATIQHKVDLELSVVLELFELLTKKHPFHCYEVMHYILKQSGCSVIVPGRDRDATTIIPNEQQQQLSIQSAELSSDDHDGIHSDESSTTSHLGHADVELVGYLYEGMCRSLRSLNPTYHRLGNIRSVAGAIISELKQLDPVVHRRCLPVLVESLLLQQSPAVGAWAGKIYQTMAFLKYDLPPVYFQQLLVHSKFIRNSDIPYYDALQQTVSGGLRPVPHIVMNVVENMFPFTENIRGSFIALECVMELQQESLRLQMEQDEELFIIWQQLEEDNCTAEMRQQLEERLEKMRPEQSYIFDIFIIESMAAAASRKNHVEMMLLLWDALDLMNYKPTESIYESTILCFVQNINLIENSFVVLKDMEDAGFVPSRALVRGAALALRIDYHGMQRAAAVLDAFFDSEAEDGFAPTTTAINILMSAYAWKGDVHGCLNLLNKAISHSVTLDTDTFSFALESVGKGTKRLVDNRNVALSDFTRQSILDENLKAVESILKQFEEARDSTGRSFEPNHHFVRNYVEFLCTLGQTETASMVAVDFLEQGNSSETRLVDNKTLARVAIDNAEAGNFEMARKCLASMSESLPFLEGKVNRTDKETREEPML